MLVLFFIGAAIIMFVIFRRPLAAAVLVLIAGLNSPVIAGALFGSTTGIILAATLLAPWWVGPFFIWIMHRMPARAEYVPYDAARHDLPDSLVREQSRLSRALTDRGFRTIGDVLQSADNPSGVATRVVLMRDQDGHLALVGAVHSQQAGASMERTHVEFVTKARDGRVLLVNNAREVAIRMQVPGRTVWSFHDLDDASTLAEVNGAVIRRWIGAESPERLNAEADPSGFMEQATVRSLEELRQAGRYRLDTARHVYRPTLAGAWRLTWALLPPMSWITKGRMRRKTRRLLDELGLREAVKNRPRRLEIAWAPPILALLVVGYFLLTGRPQTLDPGQLAAQEGIPMLSEVPSDFEATTAQIQALAGSEGIPFATWRDWIDVPQVTGTVYFVSESRALALMHSAQPALAERGFSLIRVERNFAYSPDAVALFPFADPSEILRAVQTDGTNYGIGTDSIVTWMRQLETTNPFHLTDAGLDYLEVQFLSEVENASGLAHQIYAFCPDVVDQGAGSIEALAKNLRATRTLYCWWD